MAIGANLAIAICKYVAAMATRNSAMWAEAFHSTADLGNELLLFLGMKRSARPPDDLHPYGHGKVLYFYSLLVAVYIFAIGVVFAFYEGISRLRHPAASQHVGWNYAVLALTAGFDFLLSAVAVLLGCESGALLVGERTNRPRIRRVREIIESDPSVERVGDLLTMQLGPEQVLLTVNIRFRRGLDVQQLESTIARLEVRIKKGTYDREDLYRSRLPQAARQRIAGCLVESWFYSGWGRDLVRRGETT